LTAVLPRDLTSATPVPTRPVAPPRPRSAALIGFLLAVVVGVAAVVASRGRGPIAVPVERVAPEPGAVARPADDRAVEAPSADARPARSLRPLSPRRPLRPRRADVGSPPPPPPAPAFNFDPSDPASVVAAAKALERAAQRLPSDEDRTSVARCASLAGFRADASELADCIERYEQAR
ncbi:MAG: hypothetical protein RL846_30555, partial [Deltaproteobacteria bacterium]